jgi:hypothetical protein
MMRKTMTLVVALALMAALAPAAGAAGLVGQWRFDEGSGGAAADSSGNGNAGALAGSTQWVAGKHGGALRFDGGGGQMRVAKASVLEPAGAITAQAWVRSAASPGRFRYVVAKGANSCIAASYGLYSGDDGGLAFYVSSALGFDYTVSSSAGVAPWDGAWHLATGTFDGTVVRLYLDGVQVGSGVPRLSGIGYGMTSTDDVFVGHYDGCGDHDFGGDIDDVKIFDRALTASEVKAQYAYAFQGFFSPIDNAPTVNAVKAGSAVPVKFSLTGYQGMDILAAGSPSSRSVTCSTSAPVDDVEVTSTAGSSSLSYDATSDRYNYVWKTDKAWAGTCRQLSVELNDGSVHTASFKFTK